MELTLTELGGMIRDIKIRATLGAGDMIRALCTYFQEIQDSKPEIKNQGHRLGRGPRPGDLGGQEHPQEGTDPDQRSQTGFPEEDPLQRQEL